MIKKIYNSFFTYILYRNSTPLGRWSQCGEKRNVEDVIAIKIKQKEDRLFLIKNNIDPYNKYKIQTCYFNTLFKLKICYLMDV